MKKLFISIALISAFLLPSTFVLAKTSPQVASSVKIAEDKPTWENYVPEEAKKVSGLDKATKNIINILLLLAGMVAVIYIIIGGYSYITAGGNADAAAAAKNTLLNAVIGLVIVFGAFAVVKWVLDKFIG